MKKKAIKPRPLPAPKHKYPTGWADTADYIDQFNRMNQLKGGQEYTIGGKRVVIG